MLGLHILASVDRTNNLAYVNLLATDFFFQILACPVLKM